MFARKRPKALRKVLITGAAAAATALGVSILPKNASAETVHIVMEVENSLGLPIIQAIVSACLGEQVFLTGTVRTVEGPQGEYISWGPMRGMTADGDVFVGGSGVNNPEQSNLTLTEISAGSNNRLVHLQFVGGILSAECH